MDAGVASGILGGLTDINQEVNYITGANGSVFSIKSGAYTCEIDGVLLVFTSSKNFDGRKTLAGKLPQREKVYMELSAIETISVIDNIEIV